MLFDPSLRAGHRAVVDGNAVPGRLQMPCHRISHYSQPNKCTITHRCRLEGQPRQVAVWVKVAPMTEPVRIVVWSDFL